MSSGAGSSSAVAIKASNAPQSSHRSNARGGITAGKRAVRLRGDNGGGFQLLTVRTHPCLPQAGKRNRRAIARTNAEGPLPPGVILPFVKAIGGKQAPAPAHGIA